MSFRYTNNLIGAMKHRLLLEAAHRRIAQRTYTGTCNGIQVTCTGYGSVIKMDLIDRATWEPFYRAHTPVATMEAASAEDDATSSSSSSSTSSGSTNPTAAAARAGWDLAKLSTSIKAATWEAIRKIRSTKEEAHHNSLLHNTRLQADANLRLWYEEDADSIAPRAFDALKMEYATPWMQAVRFGKADADSFLSAEKAEAASAAAAAKGTTAERTTPPPRVSVLTPADCTAQAIPIGSAHFLFTPGLVQLEQQQQQEGGAAASSLSRVDRRAVLVEQKRELARDEEMFWERVELIRRGQLATIPGGVKRGYADQSSTVEEGLEEKVELRFIR